MQERWGGDEKINHEESHGTLKWGLSLDDWIPGPLLNRTARKNTRSSCSQASVEGVSQEIEWLIPWFVGLIHVPVFGMVFYFEEKQQHIIRFSFFLLVLLKQRKGGKGAPKPCCFNKACPSKITDRECTRGRREKFLVVGIRDSRFAGAGDIA